MRKVYMTLVEAVPQAKPGSRDASHENLLDRLPANRSVKALAVVAILSATLWLTGCGGNQGENKPGNKDAQKPGDKIDNPSGAEQSGLSNEVEFSAENIEAGVETAGLSILKEALEYLAEEDPENIEVMDANESLIYVGAADAQLLTNTPGLHKGTPDAINQVDFSKPSIDIQYDQSGENEFIDGNTLIVSIEPLNESVEEAEKAGGTRTIMATFSADKDKFDFFSDKEEIKKAIEDLENGKLEGLKTYSMSYELYNGDEGDEEVEWYQGSTQQPEQTAKNLNKIWSELPATLETSPSKLSLVKKLPENTATTELSEEKAGASEDQHQTEAQEDTSNTERISFEETAKFFASEEQQMLHETAVNVARDVLWDIEADENVALADTSELQEDMEYTEWYLADDESQIGVLYGKFYGMDYESLGVFFVDSEKDMTKNIMLSNLGDPENVPDVQGPEDIPEIIEYISKPESNLMVEWVSWQKTSNPDERNSLSSDDLEDGEMDPAEAREAIKRLEQEMNLSG